MGYRYACQLPNGAIYLSPNMEDSNECYWEYACSMDHWNKLGMDPTTFLWRGVFDPVELENMISSLGMKTRGTDHD